MRDTKALLAAALASSVAMSAAIARGTDVDVQLNFGPPAVVYEPVPAPRVGYIWAPGYWDYDGHHHVWRGGHWEHRRHGERWANSRWYERDGRWHLERGHWERG